MAGNISPIFSRVGDIQGGQTLTTAAADYTGLSINNVNVFQADPINGGFIQRLRFKSIGTNVATVARIYLVGSPVLGETINYNNMATMVSAVSGTPTGTPSTSGGTLQSGTYFAKIQAIDQYGGGTIWSTETASVSVTGPTGSIAWAWTAVTGAVSYRIIVGNLTGAELFWFTSSTNSFTQTVPYIAGPPPQIGNPNDFIFNAMFYGEISLPATTASTSASTPDIDYPMNIALPPGYRVVVGLGTTVAAGWIINGIAGKF